MSDVYDKDEGQGQRDFYNQDPDAETHTPTTDEGGNYGDAEDKSSKQTLDEKVEGLSDEEDADTEESDEEEAGESRAINDSEYFFDESKGKFGKATMMVISKKRARNFVIGFIITSVLSVAGLGLITGPLQFLQFANLIKATHLIDQADLTDGRFMKIMRYVRYANTPERTRLGRLGNNYADRLERKLNDTGISSRYNKDLRGQLAGYDIDTNKFDDPEVKRLREDMKSSDIDTANKARADLTTHMQTEYGLKVGGIDPATGILTADASTKYFANKKLMKNFFAKAGYRSSTLNNMRSRLSMKRAGINLHPIRKLDSAIKQSALEKIKSFNDQRRERIKNGSNASTTRTSISDEDTSGDGKSDPNPNTDGAKADASEIDEIRTSNDPPDVKRSSLRSKFAKGTGGLASIAGILCVIKGVSETIDQVNHDAVVMPLQRFAGEGLSIASQIMAEGTDLDIAGSLAEDMSGKDGSWINAKPVQAAMGQPQTGPDILPEMRVDNEGNAVTQFVNNVPGLGAVCSAMNSFFGQLSLAVVGVVTGPASFFTGLIADQTITPLLLDSVIDTLANEQVDLEKLVHEQYGNGGMYGGLHLANYNVLTSGGAALTSEQKLGWADFRNGQYDYEPQSFYAKYIDPTNAKTTVGYAMANTSRNPVENVAKIARYGASMLSPTKLFSFMNGTAKAQAEGTEFDYGIQTYGLPVDVLEDPKYDNPGENAEKAVALLGGPSGGTYIDLARNCFGVLVDTSGQVRVDSAVPPYYKIPEECNQNSEDWLRIRLFIFDEHVASAAACYEGDSESCSEFGLEGTTGSSGSAPTTDTELPNYRSVADCPDSPDVTDAGLGNASRDGATITFKLCNVLNTAKVNTVYAQNYLDFFTAGRAAGFDLTGAGGSFLPYDDALARWKERCGDRPISEGYSKPPCEGAQIAPPGKSLHELGLAVDLNCNGTILGGGTQTRAEYKKDDPCVSWVRNNSQKWGLVLQCERVRKDGTQSDRCESWHISPTGA